MAYYTDITQYFDVTTKVFPNQTALIDGDESITMQALQQCSLSLAHSISTQLGQQTGQQTSPQQISMQKINNIVAVYLPKSTALITADIAILYSGNAYMNMGIKNPKQRTLNIMEHITPSLIITSKNHADALADLSIPLLFIEDAPTICTAEQTKALQTLRKKRIDTDPLCIINTSGSTGTPKGVVLNHRSFIDYTEWAIGAGLVKDKEILASLAPPVFDHFSFELCLMMKGATLLLVPDTLAAFPLRMLELMLQHKVTFIFWVPTIMVTIANMRLLDTIDLPCLKMVWFAGEVFPTSKCTYWQKKLPQATFVNLYGPTEITVDCTYHMLDRDYDDSEPIPIGKPCNNTSILLLNDDNVEAGDGEEAELCVRGSSLGMGYYNDPEKTAKAFVQNPLNTKYPELIYRTGDIVYTNTHGEIVYKGRKDTLIKHQGYRIELAEIEHVIINTLQNEQDILAGQDLLAVTNCAVLYNAPEKIITVFYEAPEKVDEKAMRKHIAAKLPRYMVPTAYVHYVELPRNTNGKIDRLALSDTFIF